MFDNALGIAIIESFYKILLETETIKAVLLKNNIVSQAEFEEIRERISYTGERKEVLDELNDLKERMK